MKVRAHYEIAGLIIRDRNTGACSVTNDAEAVVAQLYAVGMLRPGDQLFYYDSAGQLDEITHRDGVFTGFKPGRMNRE